MSSFQTIIAAYVLCHLLSIAVGLYINHAEISTFWKTTAADVAVPVLAAYFLVHPYLCAKLALESAIAMRSFQRNNIAILLSSTAPITLIAILIVAATIPNH